MHCCFFSERGVEEGGGGQGVKQSLLWAKWKWSVKQSEPNVKRGKTRHSNWLRELIFLDLFIYFFNNLKQELIKFDGLLS